MKGHLLLNSVAALSTIVKDRLRAASLATPALDARLIIMRATGLTHEELIAGSGTTVLPEARVKIMDMVRRREGGEPLSRIMGEREFYSRSFALNNGTLDPRADTETLVDAALGVLREQSGRAWRIADLGTGSGAVIITLLAEMPETAGVRDRFVCYRTQRSTVERPAAQSRQPGRTHRRIVVRETVRYL